VTLTASWPAPAGAQVVVKPVIDLADHVHHSQYEVPDRMAEAAVLVDQTLCLPVLHPARSRCRPDADCDHEGITDARERHTRTCTQPRDS